MFTSEIDKLRAKNLTIEGKQAAVNIILNRLLDEKLRMVALSDDIIQQLEEVFTLTHDDHIRYRLAHLYLRRKDYCKAKELLEGLDDTFYEHPIARIYLMICLYKNKQTNENILLGELKDYVKDFQDNIQKEIRQEIANRKVQEQRSLFNYLELLIYMTDLPYEELEPILSFRKYLTRSTYMILTHRQESRISRYRERIESEIQEYNPSDFDVYINFLNPDNDAPDFEPKERNLFLGLAINHGKRISNESLWDWAWDHAEDVSENKLKTNISSIRTKIRNKGPHFKSKEANPIQSVERGYRLVSELTFCIIARERDLRIRIDSF